MQLQALGVGDAFTARWWTTCVAVHAEGQTLLVDCPHPIRRVLGDGGLDVGDVLAVALTHLHADHASGLEGFGFYSHFVLGRRARLLCHPEVHAELWPGHLRGGMRQLIDARAHARHAHELADFFAVTELSETTAVQVGPFRIEARRTIHHIPTFALRIEAGGRRLGWSSDTAFDPSLIAWLCESDRVVHETNLGAHTPYERLAALPREVRDKLWLTHYPDDFDLDGSVIEPLRQGQTYRVVPPGSGRRAR